MLRSITPSTIRALALGLALIPALSAEVVSFTLINADSDTAISGYAPLTAGVKLDLAALPTRNLAIRAEVSSAVGSVVMSLSGAQTRRQTENTAPYSLMGDKGGNYPAWTPSLGNYTITGTSYAQSGGKGTAGRAYSLSFSVVNGGSTPPPPPNPGLNIPAGRIAISHDGNQHDPDDIGALALNGALLWAAGVANRVVHIDHSNHLGDNKASMEAKMVESATGIVSRFNIPANRIFNCQRQLSAAIANFKAAAEASSASNPLWYICSGPMEVPYRCLAAVNPASRQFIHCVSHSSWNENHADTPQMTHRWSHMKADFPTVTFHDIIDQNVSDGDNDWSTPPFYWHWLRDSSHEPYRWVFNRDQFNEKFDPSDAGMTYWFLSGGSNGGDARAGWPEAKALLEGAIADDPGEPLLVEALPISNG